MIYAGYARAERVGLVAVVVRIDAEPDRTDLSTKRSRDVAVAK